MTSWTSALPSSSRASPLGTRVNDRLPSYTFRTTWRVAASVQDAFAALADIEGYPGWWPEIKEIRPIDEDRVDVRIRAALPYSLRVRLHKEIEDRETLVLRTALTGDLEGWSSWSMTALGTGCILRFDEEVVTTKPIMNALTPIARPIFRLNHSVMMRHGERGLRRLLQ